MHRIGPARLNIRTIGFDDGPAMIAQLLRYAHWPDRPSARSATVMVAGPSSPIGAPPVTWPFGADNADRLHNVLWNPDLGLAMATDAEHGIWYLADMSRQFYLVWIADIGRLPPWEYTAPLRHVVHWMGLSSDAVLAHLAVFGDQRTMVAVTGPSGAGKSTLAASALAAGMNVLAEDLCWIDLAGRPPLAARVFDSIKLTEQSLARFDALTRLKSDLAHEELGKTVLSLPPANRSEAPLNAMFCLAGGFGEEVKVTRCGKARAFQLLAPSTVFLMRTAAAETARRLGDLVGRLPSYEVVPGSDPIANAKTIMGVARGKALVA